MYKIYFPELGITQYKKLIPHDKWLEAIKLKDDKMKKAIAYLSGGNEWFTENSPYYKAISTGIFNCNNYQTKCIVHENI